MKKVIYYKYNVFDFDSILYSVRHSSSESIENILNEHPYNKTTNKFFPSARLEFFGSFILKINTERLLILEVIYFDKNNALTAPYLLGEELVFQGLDLLKIKSSGINDDYAVVEHHLHPPNSAVIFKNNQNAISYYGARINSNPIYLQKTIAKLPSEPKIEPISTLDYKWYVSPPSELLKYNSFEEFNHEQDLNLKNHRNAK